MHPVLFTVIGIQIKTSYTLWVLSSVIFMLWTRKRGECLYGLDANELSSAIIFTYIYAVAGALLFGALESGCSLLSASAWRGDLSSAGGILCGFIAAVAASVRYRFPWKKLFDAAAIPSALAIGVWRLGCLAEGCCKGAVTQIQVPFLLYYPGETTARLPFPLAESIYAFVCVLLLLKAERHLIPERRRGNGAIAGTALVLYGVFRLATDCLRAENSSLWGLSAFIIFILSGTCLIVTSLNKKRGKR